MIIRVRRKKCSDLSDLENKGVLLSKCPSDVPGALPSALKLTINLELLISGLKSACAAAKDRAHGRPFRHKRE